LVIRLHAVEDHIQHGLLLKSESAVTGSDISGKSVRKFTPCCSASGG
jgi:hypothetical protein